MQESDGEAPARKTPTSHQEPANTSLPSDDPNENFWTEQQKREMSWENQRAAKKTKTVPSDQHTGEVTGELKKKLKAKTEECESLKQKLSEVEQLNAQVDFKKVNFYPYLFSDSTCSKITRFRRSLYKTARPSFIVLLFTILLSSNIKVSQNNTL